MSQAITAFSLKLQEVLKAELPGRKSHLKMVPEPGRSFNNDLQERIAAVMVLLFQEKSVIKISFIKRTEYDGPHSGQISFPGGMKEETDIDLMHTSIRETSEETGVTEKDVHIIGKLSPLFIPVSKFEVHPFIGYLEKTPVFSPDPFEVEYMINIPLRHLLDKRNQKKEKRNLMGENAMVPFYSYRHFKIWGATAMILSEFLDIIPEGIELYH